MTVFFNVLIINDRLPKTTLQTVLCDKISKGATTIQDLMWFKVQSSSVLRALNTETNISVCTVLYLSPDQHINTGTEIFLEDIRPLCDLSSCISIKTFFD